MHGSRTLMFFAVVVALSGCLRRSRGGSTSEASAGYRGTVTFTNRSGQRVCRIEALHTSETNVDQAVELGDGESTTFEARGQITHLAITECGGENTLFGVPSRDHQNTLGMLSNARLVLYPAGETPTASDHQAIVASPMPFSTWFETELRWYTRAPDARMRDPETAAQFLTTLRAHASSSGWTETFTGLMVLSDDWQIVRHRATGIVTGRRLMAIGLSRFPDGHCQFQQFYVSQAHDGSDFAGPWRHAGQSSNVTVPCAITEYFTAMPEVAQ